MISIELLNAIAIVQNIAVNNRLTLDDSDDSDDPLVAGMLQEQEFAIDTVEKFLQQELTDVLGEELPNREGTTGVLDRAHALEVGGSCIIEVCSRQDSFRACSRVTITQRFAREYKDRKYSAQTLMAVGRRLDPIYLVRITRVA